MKVIKVADGCKINEMARSEFVISVREVQKTMRP
jgi:hypothetical protein